MPRSTHLNFQGDARAALEFYQSVFGGELMVATYADFGAPKDTPDADKVVFGQVAAENGFRVMAYDVPTTGQSAGPSEASTRRENGVTITQDSFFISLRGGGVDEIGGTGKSFPGRDRSRTARLVPVGALVREADRPLRRHLGCGRRSGLQRLLTTEGWVG